MTENSTDSHFPKQPTVSGLGTVKVDGQKVYDTADVINDTLKDAFDGDSASARQAVHDAVNTAEQAAQSASNAGKVTGDSFGEARSAINDALEDSKDAFKSGGKWGMWVGVALVTLGVFIFIDMLSVQIPAINNIFGGVSFWRWWPLLIVYGGIAVAFSPAKESPNPSRIGTFSVLRLFEGLWTSVLGLILLGNMLFMVSWLVWPAMLSFWPLLLVIIGLTMLSRGLRTEWFSIIAYIISIVIMVAVASSLWIGAAPLTEPFSTLAQLGAFRGMDIWNIGNTVGINFGIGR